MRGWSLPNQLRHGRPHFPRNPLGDSDFRHAQVIGGLQVEPGSRVTAEVAGQVKRGISRNSAALAHDVIDSRRGHLERPSQCIGGQACGPEKFLAEDLARMYWRLNLDNFDDSLQRFKVRCIACVERQAICGSRRRDQQVGQSRAARLAGSPRGGKYPAIHAGALSVEWERIPGRSCPLQTILTAGTLVLVLRRMWPRREFRESDRGYGGLVR